MKAMPIVARTAFLVLVGATFPAFFVAQRLKSAPPVIDVGRISSVFSPNRDGERDVNQISIALKTADDATGEVIRFDGDRGRRPPDSGAGRPTRPLRLTWDGRSDSGRVVPDGRYQV